MDDTASDRIKKLKKQIFAISDTLEFELKLEKLYDKKYANDFESLVKTSFLDELIDILKTGDMWKFNPTCLLLFIKDNKFEFNRSALEADVLKNGEIMSQEIDVKSNLYSLTYEISLLLSNARQIDEQYINNSESVWVQTSLGEIEI